MASETSKYVIERQYTADSWYEFDQKMTLLAASKALKEYHKKHPNEVFRLVRLTKVVILTIGDDSAHG